MRRPFSLPLENPREIWGIEMKRLRKTLPAFHSVATSGLRVLPVVNVPFLRFIGMSDGMVFPACILKHVMERQAQELEKQQVDMEFKDEINFMIRAKRVKLAGITLMIIVIAAALGGLFGYSGWTRMTEGNKDTLAVEYERFLRATRETPLRIYVNTATIKDSVIRVSLSSNYIEKVQLRLIEPEPARTETGKYTYTLVYPIADHKGVFNLTLLTIARIAGNTTLTVSAGNETKTIRQFIYP
jgi:hypothetical protein